MTKAIGIKLLDSSAWIDYLEGGVEITKIVDSGEELLTSAISIFEIRKKLLKEKIQKDLITKIINFLTNRSSIMDITIQEAMLASDLSLSFNLAAVDSLIFATAKSNGAILVTSDKDFKGLEGVTLLR